MTRHSKQRGQFLVSPGIQFRMSFDMSVLGPHGDAFARKASGACESCPWKLI